MTSYIQIGSNSGDEDDFTYFLKNNEIICDNVLLVEPLKIFNNPLYTNFKKIFNNIIIENIAITETENTELVNFYYSKTDDPNYNLLSLEETGYAPKYGCASLYKDLILTHNFRGFEFKEKDIIEVKVKSLTLNQLIKQYNINNIPALFVDAEGEDVNILSSFNIEKYLPQHIFFENKHSDNIKLNKLYDRLSKLGYSLYKNIGWCELSTHAILN